MNAAGDLWWDDKNNYLVPKAIDWGTKASLKSEKLGSLKEFKKKKKKAKNSSGYPGLWLWSGSWRLSLGEGFRSRQTTGGGREEQENQICLGNRWWIEWRMGEVAASTRGKRRIGCIHDEILTSHTTPTFVRDWSTARKAKEKNLALKH